jgi:excisionase family DNA binding protein
MTYYAEGEMKKPMNEQLEKQEYLSIDEAAQVIGWNRATVYEWVKTLGMKTYKFVRNRKTYLAASDVARLKEIKEKPWTAGERKPEESVA